MDVYELVTSTRELLQNVIKRLTEVAELYTNFNYEVANERLSFLTEDLSVLLDAVIHLNKQYTRLEVEELQEKLNLVLEGLEAEDYLLVADLLVYEFRPLLESWEAYLVDA